LASSCPTGPLLVLVDRAPGSRPTRRPTGEHPPGSCCRPKPHPRGGDVQLDGRPPTVAAQSRVRSGVGMRGRSPPSGLAAQPLPDRPRPGRRRLPARRTARQRQRRHGRARDHVAVAAQGLHLPRSRHAHSERRDRAIAAPANWPTGHPGSGSGVRGAQSSALPARERSPEALYQWVRRYPWPTGRFSQPDLIIVIILMSKRRPHWIRRPIRR
jgi:hypothetical protein